MRPWIHRQRQQFQNRSTFERKASATSARRSARGCIQEKRRLHVTLDHLRATNEFRQPRRAVKVRVCCAAIFGARSQRVERLQRLPDALCGAVISKRIVNNGGTMTPHLVSEPCPL